MSDQISEQIQNVHGEVKWFDPRKGYGFIIGPESQDIFVHYTAIEGAGFRVLRDGAMVTYDAERSQKGWKATRVARPDADHHQAADEPRHATNGSPHGPAISDQTDETSDSPPTPEVHVLPHQHAASQGRTG